MKKDRTGLVILSGVAVLTAVGGFLMDWNKTHLFNPKWTPHAKFHDALSILLGTFLGSAGLYMLQKKTGNQQQQLKYGATLPAFFWTAMAGSFAFPGAKGLDAEFPELVPHIGPIRLNEGSAAVVMLAAIGVDYALESRFRKDVPKDNF